MNLKSLRKPQLLELSKMLGLSLGDEKRKPEIIEAIEAVGADDDELSECLELMKEREQDERKKAEAEAEAQRRADELEMKRLELEILKAASGSRVGEASSGGGVQLSFKMKDLMQPFKVGEDMGLFLVNFERTCEKVDFPRDTWPQRLLTLLPCEAADVVARLTRQEAEDYSKVKACLLKKYRLSAEAYRQRFREGERGRNESYSEFAYKLMANFQEWLKEEGAFGDHDKVVQRLGLEQFYRRLPTSMRSWVMDKSDVTTVTRAAELADEFLARHASEMREGPKREFKPKWQKDSVSRDAEGASKKDLKHHDGEKAETKEDQAKHQKKVFEKRQPLTCFNCRQPGHVAAGCKNPRVAFLSAGEGDVNMKLLEPYIREMTVNGKCCRVLRDSAATMDVVHPSYVTPEQFSGECAWIKQAVEANSVCLPIARICIEGPFGILDTEAAVSPSLPPEYPYLFSNRSDELLRQKGLNFGVVVQALTRSKARELAAIAPSSNEVAPSSQCMGESSTLSVKAPLPATVVEVTPQGSKLEEQPRDEDEFSDFLGEVFVPPTSESLQELLGVNRAALIAEQKRDATLQNIKLGGSEGVAKKNVLYQERGGILYRRYRDRKGVQFDQLVVPEAYRKNLLHLVHGSAWSGHLGVKKTKDRLLQEYYWPGCFRDAEEFVRTCDTCQRLGKPGDKARAPMKLVPIISEPFRRLVIDTVGPLPATESGHRHILTVLCPATKFPEAVPLKELSSAEIVNALLAIFTRVGFPAEIQCDQGTVFTSALTTTFLEKCGIRLLHSSVYHPQSNSVEKLHSVMKRLLRALCFERKTDWDRCLPATMFALRTVPHEATGFAPAELVYGRSLRSPLRILRESWEGRGEDPTVVEYVLALLDRLHHSQELAEGAMAEAQQRAKRYYDRNARARKFEVGDKVMLLRPCQKNKLELQWEGPAQVIQKLSETNYVVRIPGKRKQQHVYHSNLLKPYRQREVIVSMALNFPEEMPLDFPELGPVSSEEDPSRVIEEMIEKAHLEPNQKCDLRQLLREFEDRFSDKPGRTSFVVHDIELTSAQPVRSKPYRVSPRQQSIMEAEIKRMLELDVIEACESDYTSPLILVEVPGKNPRPCIDYRKLNLITKDQTYPIPHIEERIERVSGARFISTLDLVRGYWQVPLTEQASRYAAFISPLGTFRPKVLSFGLKNAPYCFCGLMDKVLKGMESFALPYLDDVAIFSRSWTEHVEHLRAVLNRLREAGLTVKASKCQLVQAEVTYLGHVIGQGNRRPSEVKVAAIRDFPQPRTKTDIRSFLGVAGYYQRYIHRYSELASPLTDALRKTEPLTIKWDEKKEQAFNDLKKALTSQPVLTAPDYNKPFVIQCDASDRGMGVVLCQKGETGDEHPVLYASRKLTVREEAYSASEKECACLVWAVQKLACYIAGSHFVIETDHCPLTWLQTMSAKNGRLLRWSLALQQYSFEVRYKKGKLNGNADGLSRCP